MRTVCLMTAALSAALLTSACTTTSSVASDYDPVVMSYRMPKTTLSAAGTFVLKHCSPQPEIETTIALVAKAAPAATVEFKRSDLDSWSTDKQLDLKLNPNGTLASINSEATDRRAEIIGSILKTVASVIPVVADVPLDTDKDKPRSFCNTETRGRLARIDTIDAALEKLRADLPDTPARAAGRIAAINALVSEKSGIEEKLTISFATSLDPAGGKTAVAADDLSTVKGFDDWLVNGNQRIAAVITLSVPEIPNGVAAAADRTADCARSSPEKAFICLPRPVQVRYASQLALTFDGQAMSGAGASAADAFPFAQWGPPAKLALNVGFGGKRSFAASYDAFGRTTEASWGSQARGADAAAAIVGYADQAAAFAKSQKGPDQTALDKTETDRLTAAINLKNLRDCKKRMDEGGTCDPSEPLPPAPKAD